MFLRSCLKCLNTQCHLLEDSNHRVGSEVLTAVVMDYSVFWDVTPYSPAKLNGYFEGDMFLQNFNQVSKKIDLFIRLCRHFS
jgi:hypothetical protein